MEKFEPKFLSITELAERLGFTRQYISKLVKEKKIKSILVGKRLRIPIEEAKRIEKRGV